MGLCADISEALQKGKAKLVKELVEKALAEGISASDILNNGLLAGMDVIGEKFKNNEVYVPDVLIAARAMNSGTAILKPHLAEAGQKTLGKVAIGTVKGDLHDIGKNLVRMMIEGKGAEVYDLGVDVSAEMFYDCYLKNGINVICCSALLTTTMGEMKNVVDLFTKNGVRDKVTIMVGGAPITDTYCKSIGADIYTPDAATAADVCKNVMLEKYAS
jgi:corrinoid protein of di/trimethylamine methyltransferase